MVVIKSGEDYKMKREEEKIENITRATHYDQIGWLITSFFLIFLGTILPEIIGWVKNPIPIDPAIVFSVIGLVLFFSIIVTRLFLRSQMRKNQAYGTNNFFNFSIILYLVFIFLIQIFLGFIIFKVGLISLYWLIALIIILVILLLLICLESVTDRFNSISNSDDKRD